MSTRALVTTWIALLALAGVSLGLSYLHMGSWGVPAALLIAAVKVALVLLVFMELAHEAASVRIAMIAAAVLIGILIGLVLLDRATRVHAANPDGSDARRASCKSSPTEASPCSVSESAAFATPSSGSATSRR